MRARKKNAARGWTAEKSGCYNPFVFAYALTAFMSAFALFLLGFSIFMYHENRKFGDNQFTVKLLPPPPRLAATPVEGHAKTYVGGAAALLRESVPAPALSNPS